MNVHKICYYHESIGMVDLSNNWSVGGRMCHIDVRCHFLQELKEDGFIRVE